VCCPTVSRSRTAFILSDPYPCPNLDRFSAGDIDEMIIPLQAAAVQGRLKEAQHGTTA